MSIREDREFAIEVERQDELRAQWESEQEALYYEEYDTNVYDEKGVPLVVGDRVVVTDEVGVVTEITDADGDVDEDGRRIYIAPTVVVRFDSDGETEGYSTYSNYESNGKDVCEEAVKVTAN